jgi:hypothetical protein
MTEQIQRPPIVLVGPKQLTVQGEVYDLKEMVADHDDEEEPIVSAKLSVRVEEDITLEELHKYLEPYMNFEVWKLHLSTYNLDCGISVQRKSELLDRTFDLTPQLGWEYGQNLRDFVKAHHPSLRNVWEELTSWNNVLKHPLIDGVTEMMLVSDETVNHSPIRRTLVFGCGNSDCRPTLQSATAQSDYDRFTDFFTHCLDKTVEVSICYQRMVKTKQFKSQEAICVGEKVEKSGWQCAR